MVTLVRVNNVTNTSFDVRVQRPRNSEGTNGSDVYCVVAESGVHTLPDGTVFEAGTVFSKATNGSSDWSPTNQESLNLVTNFPNPVVIGQVMSEFDGRFSTFWSSDCSNETNPPDADGICIGKQVGEDNETTRAEEVLGYIVVESGAAGPVNQVNFLASLGGASIQGVENGPPFSYTIGNGFTHGVATISAMNGNERQ